MSSINHSRHSNYRDKYRRLADLTQRLVALTRRLDLRLALSPSRSEYLHSEEYEDVGSLLRAVLDELEAK